MDVMEFQCSEDGYVQTAMGLKGVDWDRDENGNIISLLDEDVLLVGLQERLNIQAWVT